DAAQVLVDHVQRRQRHRLLRRIAWKKRFDLRPHLGGENRSNVTRRAHCDPVTVNLSHVLFRRRACPARPASRTAKQTRLMRDRKFHRSNSAAIIFKLPSTTTMSLTRWPRIRCGNKAKWMKLGGRQRAR